MAIKKEDKRRPTLFISSQCHRFGSYSLGKRSFNIHNFCSTWSPDSSLLANQTSFVQILCPNPLGHRCRIDNAADEISGAWQSKGLKWKWQFRALQKQIPNKIPAVKEFANVRDWRARIWPEQWMWSKLLSSFSFSPSSSDLALARIAAQCWQTTWSEYQISCVCSATLPRSCFITTLTKLCDPTDQKPFSISFLNA